MNKTNKIIITLILLTLSIITIGINHINNQNIEHAKLFMGYNQDGTPICIELEDSPEQFDARQDIYKKMNLGVIYLRCK